MIIDKRYKVIIKATGKAETFVTSLTESDFYKSLDGVYGVGAWFVVDVAEI